MSRYPLFPREQLQLRPIVERGHDLAIGACLPLEHRSLKSDPVIVQVGKAVRAARLAERPVVLFLGGHSIKLGLSRFLIDLIERGLVTHLATNGAGIIHDFELALGGGTSEDVAKWIKVGQFGLWQETNLLNDAIREAATRGEGLGEGVGRFIEERRLPHRELSVVAAGWRCGIPITSHVTIGGDIIHSMPGCDGAALGQTSYTDFLILAHSILRLEGGVFLNIGSAVTGPEVYLKALSMARNVARQRGEEIRQFTTAVFDLVKLPPNWHDGPPGKDQAGYYFRPWKTILIRTIADGGQSHYVQGDFQDTLPSLWSEVVRPSAHANRSPAPLPEANRKCHPASVAARTGSSSGSAAESS